MPAKTWGLFLLYLALCGVVLGAVAALLIAYKQDAREAVIAFVFPKSWHFAVDILLDRFFENQQRIVLINAVITGGLMVVTMTLFIVKEMVSASFETDGKLTTKQQSEFPLWEQGAEEVKLLLLFFAVQGSIFWIGYYPGAIRATTATVLSHMFLFFTFAIDFIAPVFQRHAGYYSQIIKLLATRPLTSIAFGAIFAAPVLVVGHLWALNPDWSWEVSIGVMFGANVVGVAWAAVAGTWLGCHMLDDFEATPRSNPITRIVAWLLLIAVLVYNGYTFGSVGLSVYHKTQILKCKYSVDYSSFSFDKPDLLSAFTTRKIDVGVKFDVTIENPTKIDVELEQNRVEVEHKGDHIATAKLSPTEIPAGETVRETIKFSLSISPLELRKGRSLFERDAWKIVLYLQVAEKFEFPIYLLDDDNK